MYNRIYYDKNTNEIHLWDDITGYEVFKYKKYAYTVDDSGDTLTIDDKKVRKVSEWSETAERMGLIYEHDVQPELRTLIDRYYLDESLPQNRILYLDIEVKKNEKYSTAADANNEIYSIAYKSNVNQTYYVCVYNEAWEAKATETRQINVPNTEKVINVVLTKFNSEYSLLNHFFNEYSQIDPTILSGWNIDYFDMPYLYNRALKIIGKKHADKLSPIGRVKRQFDTIGRCWINIAGVSICDGMFLYKKFTFSEESSYSLNAIATKELGRGKVEYEGTLDQLFKDDIDKLILYNVVDVELPIAIDEKMGLMDIAIATCHKGFVSYDKIQFPSMYIEGAILAEIKKSGKVSTSRGAHESTDPAEGAYVKLPPAGLYKWVYDLDLTSLYPWNIITLNISPETKYGRILNYNEQDYIQKTKRQWIVDLVTDKSPIKEFTFDDFSSSPNKFTFDNTEQLIAYIQDNKLALSSRGTLYRTDKVGVIPGILRKWFAERVSFKETMEAFGLKGDKDQEKFYDKKQMVTKILLNSVYGVLLLSSFRFYDKENGESTTLTGQSVIQWAAKAANKFYTNHLKEFNGEYEIVLDDGRVTVKHGFDLIQTKTGVNKFVFMLDENDEI